MVFASILNAKNTMEFEKVETGILINNGEINRYFYDYNNINFTNQIPAWSDVYNSTNFTTKSVKNQNNDIIDNEGDYFTYLYDGIITTPCNTTLYMGAASDDDCFVYVAEGKQFWSDINLSSTTHFSNLTSLVHNLTLVCDSRGAKGTPGSYSSQSSGSYTFEANRIYTILMKFTEHAGGIGFKLAFDLNNSLQGASSTNTPFPDFFGTNFIPQTYLRRVRPIPHPKSGSGGITSAVYFMNEIKTMGLNNYIDTGTSIAIGTGTNTESINFTLMAWIFWNKTNNGNGGGDYTNDRTIFGSLDKTNNDQLHCTIRDGNYYFGFYGNDMGTSFAAAENTWEHVTFIWDNGYKRIFINNGSKDSDESTGYRNSSHIKIGKWDSSHYFDGQIAYAKIFDKALSESEIATERDMHDPS